MAQRDYKEIFKKLLLGFITEEEYSFVWIDAFYEKVREDGRVIAVALMIAYGVNRAGEREESWREFFRRLKRRGMKRLKLYISDAHPGIQAAVKKEWGEWMRETLLLDVPHRQVVFTIPRMLRIFFKYKRRLLDDLCQAAVQALLHYFQTTTGAELRPGIVASIQTFGQKINLHPHLYFLVTEGGEDSDYAILATFELSCGVLGHHEQLPVVPLTSFLS